MPFTFSHPAAVLPLLREGRGRGPLIATGLVAGSLAPDLPFFLDSPLPGSYGLGRSTHRAWAVPTLDVALAAGLAGAWYGLLREPVVALLPQPLAGRVDALTGPARKPADLRPADAAWFAASAAIGAFTHVAWDAFTHHGRWGERHWPALGHRIAGRMPVYQALQWTTSAAGLAALAVAARRPLAETPAAGAPVDDAAVAGRVVVAASTLLGAGHRLWRDRSRHAGRRMSGNDLVGAVSFGGGAGAALGAAGWALSALRRGHASNMTDREREPAPRRR
ncbi:DUF4184 family protein [Streptacidiphilus jiangxiensis]|uniref:DUF4184 family protein n=1 Tax=Streptacidiphilus jiangxiensis TaxID=235985 RepID=A0A1H7Z6X0_STRJI|nr:DUF4184 family protein [Streptacidiphilus jiangxiensis]SEM53734.1 protein of unknown function [Streptacidiphilus jiangxiensis]